MHVGLHKQHTTQPCYTTAQYSGMEQNTVTFKSDLEAVLVDVAVSAWRTFLGLAEEHEVLKEKHSSRAFPTSLPDNELVLSQQISLLQ